MSSFVPPSWIFGMFYYALWIIIPLLLGVSCLILSLRLPFEDDDKRLFLIISGGIVFIALAVCGGLFLADWGWHYQYEVPSVQQKVITVDNWQPSFNKYWGKIKGADDLMMQTKDGELFGNKENFLFGKFNTRDVLNQLKPNGTYKITYYGWREGFNNGVPNILSVDEVINATNTSSNDISQYMNKRSIIYEDNH